MGLFYDVFLNPKSELDANDLDDWEEKNAVGSPLLVHPEAPFRKFWDIGSVFMIIYSCITVPFFLSMGTEAEGATKILDRTVDILFMIDIFLNFITARYDETDDGVVLITNMKEIATMYGKGWFAPDFLSSFPFDLVISAFNTGGPSPEGARIAKLGRMARMIKILRMVRIKRLLSKLQYAMGLKNGAVDIVQFIFLICLLAHFNACGWYLRGHVERPVQWLRAYCVQRDITPPDWDAFYVNEKNCLPRTSNLSITPIADIKCVAPAFTTEYSGSCGMDFSPHHHSPGTNAQQNVSHIEPPCMALGDCDELWTMYGSAFYWSIVTMTTVGYGDVLPQNDDERFYCMLTMTLSAVVFAFAMTSICTFIINLNKNQVFTQNRFDNLIGYLKTLGVDQVLQKRALAYFNYMTDVECQGSFYNGEMLTIELMRTTTQQDVMCYVHHKFMEKVPFLKSMDPEIFGDVCRHLTLTVTGPNDELCTHNHGIASSFIILGRGRIALRTRDGTIHEEEHHHWFGTAVLFGLRKYPSDVICSDFSDVYSLPAVAFKYILECHDTSLSQFETDLKDRGTYSETPEYMALYDDWKPLSGDVCTPLLGVQAKVTGGQFDVAKVQSSGYSSVEDELEALTSFARRQRAFISQALVFKCGGKNGKEESTALDLDDLDEDDDRRDTNMFSPVSRDREQEDEEGGEGEDDDSAELVDESLEQSAELE